MQQNKLSHFLYALITVIITVHAFVFYSLYVENGAYFKSIEGAKGVLDGIRLNGGVMMFGRLFPIWAVVVLEFVLALTLEMIMGAPCSMKLACKVFDPKTSHPVLFETALICATVGLMCPAMSLLAAFIYFPYYQGFHILTLLANWFELVCHNFPFAFFGQLFFIQPLVRTIFKALFKNKQAA